MIKQLLRTSLVAVAMTAAAAGVASAQSSAQQDLVISGSASHELTLGDASVTITVPAFTAGETSKTATASSTYSFVTTSSDQAISVAIAAASALPANSNLFVTLAGGTKVEVTPAGAVARSGIPASSEAAQTIDYEFVARPDTPIAGATVTVVYTLGAQP